jgi:hypothetical protein
MLDSVLAYLGFALVLVGLLSLIVPIRFLYVQTRSVAAVVATGGLLVVIVTYRCQYAQNRSPFPQQDLMIGCQSGSSTRDTSSVSLPPEKVFTAIRAVRANEILFFRTLIAIRRCGQPGPESILNAPEEMPLLDVATQTTFVVLADEPPRELVVGTVSYKVRASGKLTPEVFRRTLPRGVALATMNFLVTPDERGGSIVSTETRVYANDPSALRRFAAYWRVIHPGSDMIRRMWLRAIKRRAEGKVTASSGSEALFAKQARFSQSSLANLARHAGRAPPRTTTRLPGLSSSVRNVRPNCGSTRGTREQN